MKKGIKTVSILILSLLLVLSSLAGCTSQSGSNETTTASAAGTETTAAATSAADAKPTIVDTSKLKTLKIFATMDTNTSQSCSTLNDHEVFKELEKRTGVHIEWIHPNSPEQFNLMISSRDFPDLIMYNWQGVKGGAATYEKDGVIIKLNDLIQNYAPDLMNLLEKYPEAKKSARDSSGNFYFMPNLVIDPEVNLFKGPLMRIDWLEKLGLQVPTNTDELYEVLKAFRDRDPNGNGQKDEWAMSGSSKSFAISGNLSAGNLVWAWRTTSGFHLDNGKVVYGPFQPQYKDAIAYAHKLFAEGLLDPDYLVNTRDSLDAKIMDGKVGFSYHMQPTNFMTTMAEKDPTFKVSGIPYPKGPDGHAGVYDGSLVGTILGGGCIAVTTACKYPEEAVKWLNYGYTEEGNLLMNFGIEGKSYNMVNGEPVYTDLILNNPEGWSRAKAIGKWSLSVHKWAMVQDVRYYRQYVITDYSRDSIQTWKNSIEFDPFTMQLPTIANTAEEAAALSPIVTEASTYRNEMVDKFVLGKEPMENFDKFVENLKKLKMDEATKITQGMWDRYSAN